MTRSNVTFGLIDKDQWVPPASINETLAAENRQKMADDGRISYAGALRQCFPCTSTDTCARQRAVSFRSNRMQESGDVRLAAPDTATCAGTTPEYAHPPTPPLVHSHSPVVLLPPQAARVPQVVLARRVRPPVRPCVAHAHAPAGRTSTSRATSSSTRSCTCRSTTRRMHGRSPSSRSPPLSRRSGT
jgi:hypothetical protein